jgi:hypothetical protein
MALAARFDLRLSQLDIETAYLNGKMDTEVFMETPELLADMLKRMALQEKDSRILKRTHALLKKLEEPDAVCRLNKAIYGLRQAGRRWHTILDETLKNIGLTPTNADPCVYVDEGKSNFVLIYVDDILIVYSAVIKNWKAA